MSTIKTTLKKNRLVSKIVLLRKNYKKERWNHASRSNKFLYLCKNICQLKIYKNRNSAKAIQSLFEEIDISVDKDDYYYYNIDFKKMVLASNHLLGNITVDYNKILTFSLNELLRECEMSGNPNDEFIDSTKAIIKYASRISNYVKNANNSRSKLISQYFDSIINNSCNSFDEALQRILFLNQLMWQLGHGLVGLGRLDVLLYPYYIADIENKVITANEVEICIDRFCKALNKWYYLKSGALPGDTGQIIIIGGLNENGSVVDNELTHLFLKVIQESNRPDPKILYRVCNNTPVESLREAAECISTGIGSPLLSNDEIVIPKLIAFGIPDNDAYNYMISACWEPLIAGKSFDQNNSYVLNYLKPFNDYIDTLSVSEIDVIDTILEGYEKYLSKYIDAVVKKSFSLQYEPDPVMSLFVDDCITRGLDVTCGGPVYNNYGFTTVGLANVVDSLLNIEEYVIKKKQFTFDELNTMRKNNFIGNSNVKNLLKSSRPSFGHDDKQVIDLTNIIMNMTETQLKKYTSKYGGKIKFGCSSPGYIDASVGIDASFDGRSANEPFRVHISGRDDVPYTELVNFASSLDYSGIKFNGNVIDIVMTPNIIQSNIDKFSIFLKEAIKKGFFQMQMNVISSEQLIQAKVNPDLFPNLIVRVWGFSAYYNDLPESYKDVLIKRALASEGKSIN